MFQKNVRVSPALALIKFLPTVADLWHAISDVPKLFGSTNPRSWFREFQPAVAGEVPAG